MSDMYDGIDLDKASRLMLAFKCGKLGPAIMRYRLIVECGYPEHLVPGLMQEIIDTPLHMVEHMGGQRRGVYAEEIRAKTIAGSLRVTRDR